MKKIFKAFDIIDIFRLPVTLVFNKSNKLSTTSGKVLSLFILSFFIYFFCTSDMFSRLKPQILTQDNRLKERAAFLMEEGNFTFAIGVSDINNILIHDPTMFDLEMIKFIQPKGADPIIETKVLNLCKENDFKLFPEQFKNLNLNSTYCLPSAEGFKLEGYWNENTITYLYINLNKCSNSSANNYSCKSEEEINAFINDYKYINLYIRNPNVDNGNFEKPFTNELQIFFQQLCPNLYKSAEIYFQKVTIVDDIGWFFKSVEAVQDVVIGKIDYDSAFYPYPSSYYSVALYSGERETIISRKYQKLQDVLAQFGGVCNFIDDNWLLFRKN